MGATHARRRFALVLATGLLTLGAASTWAQQPASPFEQIQFKVEEGDAVDVTDATGKVVRGELRKATDTELVVDVRGELRKYGVADVTEVRARVFDKLWEGALIGTAVGAVVGGVLVGQAGDCHQDECVFYTAGFAGAGCGIGIGVDAMIRKFKLVYSAPGRPAATQVMVVPMTRNGARGAAVVVRF